jgi:peptidoglycan/xylan/chitin deacetylase (PgdA/CDA1 family)
MKKKLLEVVIGGRSMKAGGREFIVLLLVLTFAGTSLAAHQITQWPDNRKGAVSLTFDDGCISHMTLGVPALGARGLNGTFFIVPLFADNGILPHDASWGSLRNAANMGHEIGVIPKAILI